MATILCIDDNQNILELHKAILERNGYRVLVALDGSTGIALTRKESIDAVVLDFNMPGMDGNQVAEVIMKDHGTLPVVVCSGYPDDIPESLRWFADAILQKADGHDALLSAISRLIKRNSKRIKKSTPRRINNVNEQLSA
jgi:DNA-binding response OmpR family regulator